MSDLVKRLRSIANDPDVLERRKLLEAAARIEALEAVIPSKTETESHEFIGWYEGFHQRDDEIERQRQRIEALEAALRAILAVPASPTVDADIDDIVRAALAEGQDK